MNFTLLWPPYKVKKQGSTEKGSTNQGAMARAVEVHDHSDRLYPARWPLLQSGTRHALLDRYTSPPQDLRTDVNGYCRLCLLVRKRALYLRLNATVQRQTM